MNPHSTQRIRLMTRTALFAALIYLFTAYFHVPSHTGYTHIGDAFLYLSACLLPTGYAAAAGAIGAGLADLLSGYAIWMPGTVLIKSLAVLCFSNAQKRILCRRNLLALVPAWVLCIGGYYLYESLMTGNFAAPLAGIPGYLTQCTLSTIVFVLTAAAFEQVPALNALSSKT